MSAAGSHRTVLRLGALALIWLVAAPGGAADPPPPPDTIVRLRVESAAVSPGAETLEVTVLAAVADGWHINAHEPSLPSLVPTTLAVDPPAGFAVGPIVYPPAEEVHLAFAGEKPLRVYRGQVRFRLPLSAKDRFDGEGVRFVAHLRFQACDDTRCLRPANVERQFIVETDGGERFGSRERSPSVQGWLDRRGFAATLALVVLMGLGLNLTPCVYPLISVTVAYFGGQARTRGRAVLLSVMYALGIALTFSLLGLAAALSGSLFGGLLAHPATLVAIAALMVALALSNFGLYTLQPPSWLLRKVGGSSVGATGALLMGLTMGVIAAPCVGPFVVGLLVAVGSRGDPVLGFVLFFALAIGLGSPYVLLGTAMGSLGKLPRSGEWLVWVEHLFGFVLLGLALYFASPLLPASVLAVAIPCFVATAGIVLGFLDPNGRRLRYFPAAKAAFGVAALLAALWMALPSTAAGGSILWRPFSEDALRQARDAGRPAVVDFRADWCLPCLEMERTTFRSPEVAAKSEGFAMLRADVTESSDANDALLSRYRVLGVPTTIFLDPSGHERRRVVGYVNTEQFLGWMADAAAGVPKPEQASAR